MRTIHTALVIADTQSTLSVGRPENPRISLHFSFFSALFHTLPPHFRFFEQPHLGPLVTIHEAADKPPEQEEQSTYHRDSRST